jgi:hypothetical protein
MKFDDFDIPWPQKGDHLFKSESDWWHNACLNYIHSWGLYASGYKMAADLLVQHVIDTRVEQDLLIYPIVFLYRQFVELQLKEIILDGKKLFESSEDIPASHSITFLWNECRKIIEQVWPDGNKDDLDVVEECLNEFSRMDPKSMSFRYPVDTEGKSSLPEGLRYINIRSVGEAMQKIASFLSGCSAGVSEELRMKQEMEGEMEHYDEY